MKKIVINISDSTHEKLRFEAILERKSLEKIIEERIFHKPFDKNVEESFDALIQNGINKILEES